MIMNILILIHLLLRIYTDILCWGGYNLDEHNMTRNKIYKNSLEEVRNYLLYSKYKGLDISKLGMWKDLFPDTYYMNGYADYRVVNRSNREWR